MKISLDENEVSILNKGMIKEYDLSPDNENLLIKTINKPFSYLVPYYRFPYSIKVLDLGDN